jgi:4-deoxy-L-threo-5-hexosulose-uronate ketol-isomerase
MKKLAMAMMLGVAALSANAQVNYRMQTACNPQDVKTYDTQRLRSSFMMEKVLVADEINVTYSMYDRFIFGGAMPVNKELSLDTIDPLKAPYFLFNRELGVINIGGDGIVTVDGKEYELKFKEALYVGRGNQKVTFKSKDASKPAKFYINSAIAHKEYKTQWITIDGRKGSLKANSMAAGKMEESNDRVINQLIVKNVLQEGPCQLQMGLTELKPGSVWNTRKVYIVTKFKIYRFRHGKGENDVVLFHQCKLSLRPFVDRGGESCLSGYVLNFNHIPKVHK